MTPFCQFRNVFGDAVNRDLYRLALSSRPHFTKSRTSPNRHHPDAPDPYYRDWRRSTVVYDDRLREAAARLEATVRGYLPQVLRTLGIPAFPIGSCEIQLTSHNDGEYYKSHADSGTPETASRTVTFVYYFYGLPKAFAGGELVIHAGDGVDHVIEPENDSIVFFNSRTTHEVRPVVCPARAFEAGRFTLNGWIRRRTALSTDYFNERIFSWPRATAGPVSYRSSAARSALPAVIRREADAAPPAVAPSVQNSGDHATSLLRLYGDLHRQSRHAGTVDVVSQISGHAFFERYYCQNRPVLLQGAMQGSPALAKWSPAYFADNFGSVPIQITGGRNRDSDYEVNYRQTVQTTTLGRFVERLTGEARTNDFYLVARNGFFDNPYLRPLRRDLHPPADIVNTRDESPGTAKLWFGPEGTVTPLHYDEHSILFTQIHGRKHFKLIPSFDSPYMYVRNRFYSEVDAANVDTERFPAFANVSVSDVIVEPGDALFLPAGWWHWARALDVSISATFCSFHVRDRNTQLRRENR